jgi:methylated-DNA-protein-cysteine methyltransferase related protein
MVGQSNEAGAAVSDSSYTRVYKVVAKIPRGKVATYGQIAELAGMPRAARQVGYALAALRDNGRGIPWHRVLNASGEISLRSEPGFEGLQRALLEKEGARFSERGRVDFDRVLWQPGAEAPKQKSATKRKPAKKPTIKRGIAKRPRKLEH